MSIALKSIFLLLVLFGAGLERANAQELKDVRELIERKNVEKAVEKLKSLYPNKLRKAEDVARVAQWMSVFLYDETVASFEKALQLIEEKDISSAQKEFAKALLKEPHNKKINQANIVSLIDSQKDEEALTAIYIAEKQYPYFKIFNVYKNYIGKGVGLEKLNRSLCQSPYLLADERDFCRAVIIKEAARTKTTLSKEDTQAASGIGYPEALFFLWEMTSHKEYLTKYIDKCQRESLTAKQLVKLYPGRCSHVKDVERLLQPSENTQGDNE